MIDYSNWDNGTEIALPPPDNSEESKKAFINYHKAITNRDYRTAYETLSHAQRERVGNFDSYVAGYKDTLSSEVSGMKLLSAEDGAYTFEYLLTARDRNTGDSVKVQTFKGEVTMAADNGKWYVRHAKSEKINENREAIESARSRLTAEQEARAQEVARSSAGADLKDVANLSSDTSVKNYLEKLQPFALASLTKKVSRIIGPLKLSSAKKLDQYFLAMMTLAQVQRDNNNPASRAVADYFESESLLANAYAEFDRDDKSFLDKVFISPIIAECKINRNTAEENLRKIADEHGADLSDYAETEAIKRFLNFVRNL